jgi:hypothetical protein
MYLLLSQMHLLQQFIYFLKAMANILMYWMTPSPIFLSSPVSRHYQPTPPSLPEEVLRSQI